VALLGAVTASLFSFTGPFSSVMLAAAAASFSSTFAVCSLISAAVLLSLSPVDSQTMTEC